MMTITLNSQQAKYPTYHELKAQLNRFQERLERIETKNFDEICWFSEIVDLSHRFNPEWALCHFDDLELLIERSASTYQIKRIQGYRNPESKYDEEGYLKESYQYILPIPTHVEQSLLASLN